VGTPFVPQQAVKGKGCDCKGLIWGAARELGFPEADTPYAQFVHYDLGRRDGIPSALLKQGMAALFDRADLPSPATPADQPRREGAASRGLFGSRKGDPRADQEQGVGEGNAVPGAAAQQQPRQRLEMARWLIR
jgi:hypothetical protein